MINGLQERKTVVEQRCDRVQVVISNYLTACRESQGEWAVQYVLSQLKDLEFLLLDKLYNLQEGLEKCAEQAERAVVEEWY